MWKKIQDSPHYSINFTNDIGYKIYITDYISIWSIKFTRKEFLKCLEDSNEGLEYSDENDFLSKGSNMLSNPDKLKNKFFERKEDGKVLEMTLSMFIKYTLKFKCKLNKESEQLFYNKITKPLLKKIHDLHSSQSELIDLLKRKDEEIFAYKSKGKELSLISVKTNEFNEENHLSHYNLSGTNFEPYDMLQNTIKCPADEKIDLKQETEIYNQKGTVKIEPQTIHESSSNGCTSGTMNLISIDNIKQEIIDSSETTTNNQIKRRRKVLNL